LIERFTESTALRLKIDEGYGGDQTNLRFQIGSALLGGQSPAVRHTICCDLRHAVRATLPYGHDYL
jgi:hypothetical protein